MSIEFINVSKIYKRGFYTKKGKKAVDNVSFHLRQSHITGLVGNSGCGKSTIAKLLLRLIKPSSGDIIYNKKSIVNLDNNSNKKICRDIQAVFQHPQDSLNPHMTILDNLLEPVKIHKLYDHNTAKDKIAENFRLVNLSTSLLPRYPQSLSGGENQRVMICRALLNDAHFLVLDEPCSMLDVVTQAEIMQLLYQIQKEKQLTYLFITHDLDMAKYFCDDIIIMNNGQIVEKGHTDQVFNNPVKEYTKELIDHFNALSF